MEETSKSQSQDQEQKQRSQSAQTTKQTAPRGIKNVKEYTKADWERVGSSICPPVSEADFASSQDASMDPFSIPSLYLGSVLLYTKSDMLHPKVLLGCAADHRQAIEEQIRALEREFSGGNIMNNDALHAISISLPADVVDPTCLARDLTQPRRHLKFDETALENRHGVVKAEIQAGLQRILAQRRVQKRSDRCYWLAHVFNSGQQPSLLPDTPCLVSSQPSARLLESSQCWPLQAHPEEQQLDHSPAR